MDQKNQEVAKWADMTRRRSTHAVMRLSCSTFFNSLGITGLQDLIILHFLSQMGKEEVKNGDVLAKVTQLTQAGLSFPHHTLPCFPPFLHPFLWAQVLTRGYPCSRFRQYVGSRAALEEEARSQA